MPVDLYSSATQYWILEFIDFILFTQVQPKPGVISSVGGMTLGKAGMQIQVLGASLTQMPAPQPPAPVQTQVNLLLTKDLYLYKFHLIIKCQPDDLNLLSFFTTLQTATMKMPFSAEPSKEARCV